MVILRRRSYLGTALCELIDRQLTAALDIQKSGYEPIAGVAQGLVRTYPRSIRISRSDRHLYIELEGSARTRKDLRLVEGSQRLNVNSYLGQFEYGQNAGESILSASGSCSRLEHIGLSRGSSIEGADARFPGFSKLAKAQLMKVGSADGPLFEVQDDANFVVLRDVTLYNVYRNVFRVRYIRFLMIVLLGTPPNDICDYFSDILADDSLPLIHWVEADRVEIADVAHFASVYLRPMREPQIGAYLRDHPDFIRRAFSVDEVLYEQSLEWQPGTPSDGDSSIRPDLLLRRSDGCFDIADFKLPLLGKQVTKGPRKRRRFVDSVAEGAAQLAHYEEYFKYLANAEYASAQFGIRIRDPKCTLIVGSDENISTREVDEALRTQRNLAIIDYDTLARLYLENRPLA